MAIHKDIAYLRPVEKPAERAPLPEETFSAPVAQSTLFASSNEALLCVVDCSQVSEAEFLRSMLGARPKIVVDLRVVPRFDIGGLNRSLVFSIFGQVSARYVDLSGVLEVRDRRDSRLNPSLLVDYVKGLYGGQEVQGPIFFLLDSGQATSDYISALVDSMRSARSKGWEALRIPVEQPREEKSSQRELLFISHANPEDNDFVRWLSTQLLLAGYPVWSDIKNLKSGDQFWSVIEEVIRTKANRVLVVVSPTSQKKDGVLDEIACALAVEKKNGIQNFVIPIKIGGLPFSDIVANLARRNIIDFDQGWLIGLESVLVALDDAHVSRTSIAPADSIRSLWNRVPARTLVAAPEKLMSNWIRILQLPDIIELDQSQSFPANFPIDFGGIRGRFATENAGANAVRISTENYLKGGVDGLSPVSGRNSIVSILRTGWDNYAFSRGLLPFNLSSNRIAWYVPAGLVPNDFVSYRDITGKNRRKYLVGRSEKRQVFWHFGVEMRPSLARDRRFSLHSHILFTRNGKDDFPSVERMHSLRRGFCKSWWNDRWRDLNVGFLSWLSSGHDWEIPLSSGDLHVRLAGTFSLFECPVSLSRDEADRFDEAISELEWEELDSGEDDGEFEDSEFVGAEIE